MKFSKFLMTLSLINQSHFIYSISYEIICKVIAADGEMRASKALRQVIDFKTYSSYSSFISGHILAAVIDF